jgi:hypothetical protein
MISVRAVELTIYFALVLGVAFALVAAPARAAWPLVLAVFPAVALALVTFAAARVAQTVIARGLPPAVALAGGFDVVFRRLPSLTRLGVFGALVTAPFWITAALMPFPLGSALVGAAALWLYAALSAAVGADARLATG